MIAFLTLLWLCVYLLLLHRQVERCIVCHGCPSSQHRGRGQRCPVLEALHKLERPSSADATQEAQTALGLPAVWDVPGCGCPHIPLRLQVTVHDTSRLCSQHRYHHHVIIYNYYAQLMKHFGAIDAQKSGKAVAARSSSTRALLTVTLLLHDAET